MQDSQTLIRPQDCIVGIALALHSAVMQQIKLRQECKHASIQQQKCAGAQRAHTYTQTTNMHTRTHTHTHTHKHAHAHARTPAHTHTHTHTHALAIAPKQ